MIKQIEQDKSNRRDRIRLGGYIFLGVFLIIVIFFGRQTVITNTESHITLIVYAFSTQEEVLTQKIFPMFERQWEGDTGCELTIESVFGPSTTLTGQINLGSPADIAILSSEQHVNYLKSGRRVYRETQPVLISTSPMVIITRVGNPKGIANFSDLSKPDVQLLHADPRSSGAAIWGILAEYGSIWLETNSKNAAKTQLKAIWQNVHFLAPSARAAMTLFELGAGDALVTYEHDALLALARDVPLEIILPPRTIVAHHVAVIVDDNITPATRSAAQGFIRFLMSDEGQLSFSNFHIRPISEQSSLFPAIDHPFTVEAFGGWPQAYSELIESLWQTEIEPELNLNSMVWVVESGED